MKVYVLLYDTGYDASDFLGVFSSKENAEKRIEQFSSNCKGNFDIEETEIDEELK